MWENFEHCIRHCWFFLNSLLSTALSCRSFFSWLRGKKNLTLLRCWFKTYFFSLDKIINIIIISNWLMNFCKFWMKSKIVCAENSLEDEECSVIKSLEIQRQKHKKTCLSVHYDKKCQPLLLIFWYASLCTLVFDFVQPKSRRCLSLWVGDTRSEKNLLIQIVWYSWGLSQDVQINFI